jgi:serine O-acetyltransferase
LLFFKGFHAIQTYRYAHTLLRQHRRALAQFLQSRSALVFGVDINPAARLGSGIMIDHGTGVVIGETAVIEDGVSMSAPALGCSATSRLELAPRSERAVWS